MRSMFLGIDNLLQRLFVVQSIWHHRCKAWLNVRFVRRGWRKGIVPVLAILCLAQLLRQLSIENGETRREVFELDNYDYSIRCADRRLVIGSDNNPFFVCKFSDDYCPANGQLGEYSLVSVGARRDLGFELEFIRQFIDDKPTTDNSSKTAVKGRRVVIYDMREDFSLLSLLPRLNVIDLLRVRVALTSTLMSVALRDEPRLRYELPVLKIEIGNEGQRLASALHFGVKVCQLLVKVSTTIPLLPDAFVDAMAERGYAPFGVVTLRVTRYHGDQERRSAFRKWWQYRVMKRRQSFEYNLSFISRDCVIRNLFAFSHLRYDL